MNEHNKKIYARLRVKALEKRVASDEAELEQLRFELAEWKKEADRLEKKGR